MKSSVKLTPKRSEQIYKILVSHNQLNAKEIANIISCTPNAVYRDIRPLLSLGLAEIVNNKPICYRASTLSQAEELYMRAALFSFRQQFSNKTSKKIDNSLPSLSFVKDRNSMRIVTEQEAKKAKKTICIITSGHKVADSTLNIYRSATTRGVKLKAIIENHPDKNPNVDIEAYKIMKADTRYLPNLGMRLYIFDDKTVVLTSYDPRYPMRAFGIRFTYGPVAIQLQELFNQRWEQSEVLNF